METRAWDRIFRQEGKVFEEPHQDMPDLVQLLKERNARTVLDLGCGSGRHVLYLAHYGFSVYGLDYSPEGLSITREWLNQEGLSADLRLHDMTEPLPYGDSMFDAVISVQVIHHADIGTIRTIVGEIERVVRRAGLVFVTVPKTRHQAKRFEEIEPNTFMPLDGPERGLLHHIFDEDELRGVFRNFTVTDVHLDARGHYCLLASKP